MSTLSYQEKSLYGSFAAEVLVYGAYFVHNQHTTVNHVAGLIAGIIVLQIIIQSIIAIATRNRLTDERDRLILLRGYRVAYFTLASLMVLGLGMFWFHASVLGNINPANPGLGMHFLGAFFGMLVISDIVKTISQIIGYRRS
jgi:transketolase N-terminal domain/subunit